MRVFLDIVDRIFELSFQLLGPLPLFAVLSVFAVLTAVVTLVVVRWTSDQKAIRRVKDRMGAHVLEVRLFADQPGVVLRAYLSLLGNTVLYLRHSLRPFFVLAIPLLLLFTQLEAYLGRTPVPLGRDFLVRVTFENRDSLEDPVLRLPRGLVLVAPPVHIPLERQVDYRLNAEQLGTYDLRLVLPGSEYSKRVVAGGGLRRIVPDRERGGWWRRLTSPGESPLPRESSVEKIEVEYPVRVFHLGSWEIEWLVPFIALTLAAALLLKGTVRTEI
ncbi:MAG TPA: hypothetical protein VN807_03745 [Candidatus Sulfotelmatobacter sp.]|nr:hypothetical protein [Candidatus Sulfotelmatobacter sp.]